MGCATIIAGYKSCCRFYCQIVVLVFCDSFTFVICEESTEKDNKTTKKIASLFQYVNVSNVANVLVKTFSFRIYTKEIHLNGIFIFLGYLLKVNIHIRSLMAFTSNVKWFYSTWIKILWNKFRLIWLRCETHFNWFDFDVDWNVKNKFRLIGIWLSVDSQRLTNKLDYRACRWCYFRMYICADTPRWLSNPICVDELFFVAAGGWCVSFLFLQIPSPVCGFYTPINADMSILFLLISAEEFQSKKFIVKWSAHRKVTALNEKKMV